jgi:thiol-disulfide isomerase/thioredoxin
MNRWSRVIPVILACALPAAAGAQQPAQAAASPTPVPAPSDLDVRMIRLKISAGDLPSAESILEVHRAEKGEDGDYLLGLAWVARGAALLNDWKAASSHAKAARELAESRLRTPADYDSNREAVYALGTAIEVQAQALAASGKTGEAVRYLDESSLALEQKKAPFNLRARIWKRRNLIELTGRKAPAIRGEDHLGREAPSLESLSRAGTPAVLFFWWEACGDCKAQAAAMRRTVEKYAPRGVAFIAPTRFYGSLSDRVEEKERIEKAWKEIYALPDSVTVPISDEAMLRYGVSATPTFAFIDRKGVVTRYSPTRMTEERLSAAIEDLLR